MQRTSCAKASSTRATPRTQPTEDWRSGTFWRPWSNLVRSFQVSLWRSPHLLCMVFFSTLVQVINASTLLFFVQLSTKHASLLQQSCQIVLFLCQLKIRSPVASWSGSTCTLKVYWRYIKLVDVHSRIDTDRNVWWSESFNTILPFEKCFLSLAPSQQRPGVVLKGTGKELWFITS